MIEDNSGWQIPRYINSDQPHFMFILTPPYSGSTAIAKLLNTGNGTMLLHPKGEGQWLIPSLCANDRWEADKNINYESIKAVWLNKYQSVNKLVGNITTVIEKSPANMMRIREISSLFNDCSFIANNRNPYANCASILYREHDAENISADKRVHLLKNISKEWIVRSEKIREIVQHMNVSLLTYERFCENPSSIISILKIPKDVIESIDISASIKVKDYKAQKIINQNKRQITNLKNNELDVLNAIFKKHEDLLNFYDYSTNPP